MEAADNAVGGAVNVANRLSALTQPTLPPNGLGYGTTSFDQRMANLAWMLDSNLGMRVACVSYDDGWDFHDSQVSRQAQNLSRMSTTLAAFQADLEARGLGDRVITLVWSEFGRRVEDNDSGGGGTDHGAGGLALVIGKHAKGGIAAEFPGYLGLRPRPVGQPEGADRLPADLHEPAGQLDGHRPGRRDPERGQLHAAGSGRVGEPPPTAGQATTNPVGRPCDTSGVAGLRALTFAALAAVTAAIAHGGLAAMADRAGWPPRWAAASSPRW